MVFDDHPQMNNFHKVLKVVQNYSLKKSLELASFADNKKTK